MCGICGYTNLEVKTEVRKKMLNCLNHRGPDNRGEWINKTYSTWLGHTRLAIIDISLTANQPLHSENNKIHLVANGEIYNHLDLRNILESQGHIFHSHSDCEVILHGYEQWGNDVCSRLNGMFAFAIYDEFNNLTFLARDRLGIKPLYYFPSDKGLIFASELKALQQYPNLKRKIDRLAFEHYLLLGYIPAPLCIYENCCKLAPGNSLIFQNGIIKLNKYWNIDPAAAKKVYKSSEECVDEFTSLFRDSVKLRLMSNVPLGSFLSGGIDSSLITLFAQQETNKQLKTFNIGFNNIEYDETKEAEFVASFLETEHTSITMSESDICSAIPEITNVYDEPFADISALPTLLLAKIAKQNITVALSGDGGDELFYGYPRYLHYRNLMLLELIPAKIRITLAEILYKLTPKSKTGQFSKAMSYKNFAEGTTLFAGIFHKLRFDLLTGRAFDWTKSVINNYYNTLKKCPLAEIGPFLDLSFYLPDDILCKLDRATMSFGLEARVPFLDHRVVEFTNRLPAKFKLKGKTQKWLLKEILQKKIPSALWQRKKQGFSAPLAQILRGPFKAQLEELLSPEKLQQQGIFKAEFVKNLINQHMQGGKSCHSYLWTLMVFQMWFEKNNAILPDFE